MKKYYLLFLIFFTVTALSANEIVISFQPKDNTETIDSIHATNLTKGQTVKLSSGESLKIASATSSDLIKISDIGEGYLYPNPSEG